MVYSINKFLGNFIQLSAVSVLAWPVIKDTLSIEFFVIIFPLIILNFFIVFEIVIKNGKINRKFFLNFLFFLLLCFIFIVKDFFFGLINFNFYLYFILLFFFLFYISHNLVLLDRVFKSLFSFVIFLGIVFISEYIGIQNFTNLQYSYISFGPFLLFGVLYCLHEPKIKRPYILLFLFLIIVLSGSRMIMLISLALPLFFLFGKVFITKSQISVSYFFKFFSILIIITAFISLYLVYFASDKFLSIVSLQFTEESRLATWVYSIDIISNGLPLGHGSYGFKNFHNLGHPHNILLLLMEDHGIVGVFIFTCILYFAYPKKYEGRIGFLCNTYLLILTFRSMFSGIIYLEPVFLLLIVVLIDRNKLWKIQR